MLLKINKKSDIQILLSDVEYFLNDFDINKIKKMEARTIISELIYNIVKYTPRGSMKLTINNFILTIKAVDHGNGIDDFHFAIQDGNSTSGTLGLGFASIFRLSDEVDVETSEEGTIINITKRLK